VNLQPKHLLGLKAIFAGSERVSGSYAMRNAVIFDLFGTLILSESDERAHEALSQKLSALHGNVFRPEEHLSLYLKFVERGLPSLEATWLALKELLKKYGIKSAVTKEELSRMHVESHAKYATLREDGLGALRLARTHARKVGLLSDGDKVIVHAIVDALKIRHFFDAIVTFDDCMAKKPDPRLFRACLTKLGVPASEAVMIGDRCVDVEGAKRAGMTAVLLGGWRECKVPPDYVTESLLDAVRFSLNWSLPK